MSFISSVRHLLRTSQRTRILADLRCLSSHSLSLSSPTSHLLRSSPKSSSVFPTPSSVTLPSCAQQPPRRYVHQESKFQLSNGRILRISSGKFAKMTDGCAVVSAGETNVMVTAVSKNRPPSGSGFVPLTVDYKQKAAAAGRIPTHHLRREMGITEKEILTSRLIDRSLRPLFPKGFSNDTQLVCNLLSLDGHNEPDILAINAASTALALSDIPWNGPIGAVRIAIDQNQELISSPTRKESSEAVLNVVLAANEAGNIIMLEAFANEPVIEPGLIKAITKGIKEAKTIVQNIKRLQEQFGKAKRALEFDMEAYQKHFQAVKTLSQLKLQSVLSNAEHDKQSRDQAIAEVRVETMEMLREEFPDSSRALEDVFSAVLKDVYSELVLRTGVRCDGRGIDDLRPITCEVDLFKPVHGSALFQRGQTQVMCTTTLDSLDSTWRADPITALTQGVKEKNFMLHYEFPQYATGDIGRQGPAGRREIGHGALAEKALRPVVPEKSQFTTRLLAEVLESNGSSSMASVCAGSLALLDAGVEIASPAAGVAIGLLKRGEDYRVLTDISGFEDYFGEMDFKIAGTRKAFTALQLDCKLPEGLPHKILLEALTKSNQARGNILNIMHDTIAEPKPKSKDIMPVTEQITVPHNKRSALLGPGWTNAKKLMSETGINISQDVEDVNIFNLWAPNASAMIEAREQIDRILKETSAPELEFGAIYHCKIVEIKENGVMVQLHPGMQPTFLHLSQLDIRKVNHPSALPEVVLNENITVKYFGRDPVTGQIRISRKVLQAMENQVKNYVS